MGTPQIIHLSRIFHCKSSSYCGTPFQETSIFLFAFVAEAATSVPSTASWPLRGARWIACWRWRSAIASPRAVAPVPKSGAQRVAGCWSLLVDEPRYTYFLSLYTYIYNIYICIYYIHMHIYIYLYMNAYYYGFLWIMYNDTFTVNHGWAGCEASIPLGTKIPFRRR